MLKMKRVSFPDYPGVEFGIFLLGEIHSENRKRKTTKLLPAGVRKSNPYRHFCLWPIGDFPTGSVF